MLVACSSENNWILLILSDYYQLVPYLAQGQGLKTASRVEVDPVEEEEVVVANLTFFLLICLFHCLLTFLSKTRCRSMILLGYATLKYPDNDTKFSITVQIHSELIFLYKPGYITNLITFLQTSKV